MAADRHDRIISRLDAYDTDTRQDALGEFWTNYPEFSEEHLRQVLEQFTDTIANPEALSAVGKIAEEDPDLIRTGYITALAGRLRQFRCGALPEYSTDDIETIHIILHRVIEERGPIAV